MLNPWCVAGNEAEMMARRREALATAYDCVEHDDEAMRSHKRALNRPKASQHLQAGEQKFSSGDHVGPLVSRAQEKPSGTRRLELG